MKLASCSGFGQKEYEFIFTAKQNTVDSYHNILMS